MPTAVEPLTIRPLKPFIYLFIYFFKFFGTYMLTAIVKGWSFNLREMLSDLRSHRHLPILLLCLACTLSMFLTMPFLHFPFGVFFFFGKWSSLFYCLLYCQPPTFALLSTTNALLSNTSSFCIKPFLNGRTSYSLKKKKKNHKWWTIQMGLGIKKKLFGLSNGLGHG